MPKRSTTRSRNWKAARPGLEATLADTQLGQPLLHPNLAKVYRNKVEQLSQAFSDPDQGREAFEIVRSLIREVRLVPIDRALAIELTGDLAGILPCQRQARVAGSQGRRHCKSRWLRG